MKIYFLINFILCLFLVVPFYRKGKDFYFRIFHCLLIGLPYVIAWCLEKMFVFDLIRVFFFKDTVFIDKDELKKIKYISQEAANPYTRFVFKIMYNQLIKRFNE